MLTSVRKKFKSTWTFTCNRDTVSFREIFGNEVINACIDEKKIKFSILVRPPPPIDLEGLPQNQLYVRFIKDRKTFKSISYCFN